MNESPLVSVVIPCYNHAQFVQETIQSVIDQDYENIELIIIDDGSKDNSVEVIEKMISACKARFKRFEFRHRPNKGLCATLNEALEWCKGVYFSALASDDIIYKYKISLQVDYLLKNPKLTGVFGGIDMIDSVGNVKNIVKKTREYDFKKIILHNFHLPAPTQLLILKRVRDIGYDESLSIEDWYMWLRLTEGGSNMGYINYPLACYRRHDGNISSLSKVMFNGRLQVINKYKGNKYYEAALTRILLLKVYEEKGPGVLEKLNKIFNLLINRRKSFFDLFVYKITIKIIMGNRPY